MRCRHSAAVPAVDAALYDWQRLDLTQQVEPGRFPWKASPSHGGEARAITIRLFKSQK